MKDWRTLEEKYYLRALKRVPLVAVRGEGAYLWDESGRRVLDFTAGWAVSNLGHCHPVVVEALRRQGETLIQAAANLYTIPQLELAEVLMENCALDRVFFANSGAEANEGAIKLARKYGKLHLGGAYEVITTLKSFHGRTLAMVAATGKPIYQQPFTPLPAGFLNVEYNNIDALGSAVSERTCAIMLELVQGEGGVNVPDRDYVRQVRELCDARGILFIADEVQTGMSRCGSLFVYEQFGIEPDVMTLAKGLGNGVPIGALLAKEKASAFGPGDHGSTYGGNPLVCSVAHAVVKYHVEQDVPAMARRMGEHLRSRLNDLRGEFDFITEIRGLGLLLALEFDQEISEAVVMRCLEEGLLLNNVTPAAIRFMPPLTITEEHVDEAVQILTRVLRDIGSKEKSRV